MSLHPLQEGKTLSPEGLPSGLQKDYAEITGYIVSSPGPHTMATVHSLLGVLLWFEMSELMTDPWVVTKQFPNFDWFCMHVVTWTSIPSVWIEIVFSESWRTRPILPILEIISSIKVNQ